MPKQEFEKEENEIEIEIEIDILADNVQSCTIYSKNTFKGGCPIFKLENLFHNSIVTVWEFGHSHNSKWMIRVNLNHSF